MTTKDRTMMQNQRGEWVPAIPLPMFGLRKECGCGAKFWTMEGYRGHYALRHVLDPEEERRAIPSYGEMKGQVK